MSSVSNRTLSPEQRARVADAWRSFLVDGPAGLREHVPEQRDIQTSTDAAGAALLAPTFQADIDTAVKYIGPVSSLISVSRQETGVGRKIPTSDDTAAYMQYLPEIGSVAPLEQDPTLFSTLQPGSDMLISTVLYSKQEANDAEDIGKFIADIAGIRVARGLEYAVTKGIDNSPSHNVLPNSPTGGLLGSVSAGVTGAALTGPTYANLTALKASVDHAYRIGPNHGYMVNQTTHDYLVAQVDTTGRPLYKFDSNTGLLMVAGSPVYINTALASYSTPSSPVALYGDYSKSYRLINAGGIRVRILTERYADQFLNAALIYQRVQGAKLFSNAVKSLTTTG
jgi:HK97 family phage major capsid protein